MGRNRLKGKLNALQLAQLKDCLNTGQQTKINKAPRSMNKGFTDTPLFGHNTSQTDLFLKAMKLIIMPNSSVQSFNTPSHLVFKFIEKKFHEWIESSNPANEYKEKYFGDEAIYTKRGAIEQAIECIVEEANEEQKPVDLDTFDYDAVFSD